MYQIYYESASQSSLSIEGVQLTSNVASEMGGGVYIYEKNLPAAPQVTQSQVSSL